ncbi:hypothetical protein DLAC_09202 [Tieghemostelium lacteum]|uniref:THH1/TOM1/TOM3 domain-containing protein n=1 Tax=Tieghemostelium lacteum TaxID=361077 RepID=A0A151Z9F0_TIELA|nr:hypothetical protein DLAC_09202 [Tieghemostelium lacteum]|eukprot:KYQ90572.1 hypothetical protein DLAC_09202 [Tieghemostelium lacteum]
MGAELIGLIYYGNGDGLSIRIQNALQLTLAVWHFLLMCWSSTLIAMSFQNKFTKLARLVFIVVFAHSTSKLVSNILYMIIIYNPSLIQVAVAFDIFELMSIISYYCMYIIVLFSWIEVVFRVKHLGYGEEKIHFWRNLFCIVTALFILTVYIISDSFVSKSPGLANMVFGIGLIAISVFSFALSIAFIFYGIKLRQMVMSIQLNTNANSGKNAFLWKVAFLSIIFILCLDIKMIHYIINVNSPFSTTMWDLYALNYLPEVIAVSVALFFFGSRSNTGSDSSSSGSLSETERSNIERREQKKGLLSVNQ